MHFGNIQVLATEWGTEPQSSISSLNQRPSIRGAQTLMGQPHGLWLFGDVEKTILSGYLRAGSGAFGARSPRCGYLAPILHRGPL